MGHLTEDMIKRATHIHVLDGNAPAFVSAAPLYMVAALYDQCIRPGDISDKTGVSEPTIRMLYKHIYQVKEQLVNVELVEKGTVFFEWLPKSGHGAGVSKKREKGKQKEGKVRFLQA